MKTPEEKLDKLIVNMRECNERIDKEHQDFMDNMRGRNSHDLKQMTAIIIGGAILTLIGVGMVVFSVV